MAFSNFSTVLIVAPTKSSSRYLAYAACGVILTILAVLLVVSILFFGPAKQTKDVTFHIANTGEIIKENIEITDSEVQVTTSTATFIFDYVTGWLVNKLSDSGTNACYISDFKMTESIDHEKECLVNIKSDVIVREDGIYIHYKSTDKVVDGAILSPSAARMCQQSRLIWFAEITNNNTPRMVKRSEGYEMVLPDGKTHTVVYQDYRENYLPPGGWW